MGIVCPSVREAKFSERADAKLREFNETAFFCNAFVIKDVILVIDDF